MDPEWFLLEVEDKGVLVYEMLGSELKLVLQAPSLEDAKAEGVIQHKRMFRLFAFRVKG